MRLPNFFIVGAPKAGTTSAYYYLKQHPQVYMSPLKEPHYFADEIRKENFDAEVSRWYSKNTFGLDEYLSHPEDGAHFGGIVSDWQNYLRLFEGAQDAIAIGEASVGYLQSRTAPARIASVIPEARIIILLRDPAERAFSQYLHGVGNGAIRWSFREHIQRNLRYCSEQICLHYPFLEFGFYAEQVRHYRNLFGDRVWIGLHEDYRSQPLQLCSDLYKFLAVDPQFRPTVATRYLQAQVPRASAVGWLKRAGVWKAAAGLTPRAVRPFFRRALVHQPGTIKMDAADRRFLVNHYRDDIRKLANDLGRNLNAWLA